MIKLGDILNEILSEKEDRCKRIADRRYDKPSAYKSGAIVRCRNGDIWKDLKEDSNKMKAADESGVEYLFDSNPELASIGTPEQYSQYINSIFPSSKVKEILYHGSNAENIDKFRTSPGAYGTGVYLQTKHGPYRTSTFGKNIYSAIINAKQPYTFYSSFKGTGGILNDLWLQLRDKHEKTRTLHDLSDDFGNEIKNQGYDCLKIQINDTKYSDEDEFYYLIYNPDNIHILGTKNDIEGFKQFVKNKSLEEDESLHKWFKRSGAKGKEGGWVDCNAPDGKGGYKTCGRKEGEKRAKYPSCRPTPAQCKTKGKGKTWGKTKWLDY